MFLKKKILLKSIKEINWILWSYSQKICGSNKHNSIHTNIKRNIFDFLAFNDICKMSLHALGHVCYKSYITIDFNNYR